MLDNIMVDTSSKPLVLKWYVFSDKHIPETKRIKTDSKIITVPYRISLIRLDFTSATKPATGVNMKIRDEIIEIHNASSIYAI